MLLGRAEARVRQAQHGLPSIPSERLSPEAELDAILPPDLLAVLDEPLDLDDEDDEAEDGGLGTHGGSDSGGSRPGRTGQGSGGGTGTGGVHGRDGSGSPPPPHVQVHEPAPPSAVAPPSVIDAGDDEAPVTPPAIRTRNPPPMSLRTSLEPSESTRGEITAAPTAPPPGPSTAGISKRGSGTANPAAVGSGGVGAAVGVEANGSRSGRGGLVEICCACSSGRG